jgi:hypothetical protein
MFVKHSLRSCCCLCSPSHAACSSTVDVCSKLFFVPRVRILAVVLYCVLGMALIRFSILNWGCLTVVARERELAYSSFSSCFGVGRY